MARLRKAAKIWAKPNARELAGHVMIPDDGAVFAINLPAIFERRAPLEIEIGAGKGEFIIERAAARPEHDFLAIELSATITRVLAVRCGRAGLENLRVARMDARALVNILLADASVAAYHVYFPDPWPKGRHVKHRLFTPQFASGIYRTLEPGGIAYIATDVREYAGEIFTMIEGARLIRAAEAVPGARATGFARKYLAAGKPVYSASFRKPSSTASTR
jgi:tRNA (guanine-N7-)-methyltransferase